MATSAEPSPAERFAAARARQGDRELAAFRAGLGFDLDPFQEQACRRLEQGSSVLVAAPTGAGKTVVAEFAIHLAVHRDDAKVFYTTPMKALSNQKFAELVAEYGPDEVGLLTGDTSVNPEGRIVVMTTEVLRNMIYADSVLMSGLGYVVMDEVHYLADRFRGAVWEEVIIHLPSEVRMVSLSATVSNAEEFGAWLDTVRGGTDVIVSEERPVPLDQHVLVRNTLLDLFAGTGGAQSNRVNPELVQQVQLLRRPHTGHKRHKLDARIHNKQRSSAPWRVDRAALTQLLDESDLLPAIFFIFSRVGCDAAVTQLLRSGIRLTTQEEREEIRRTVEARTWSLPDEDLAVLGYWDWLEGLQRGIAAHHAGMLPAFKETVEELFQRKLVKAVFATETLALGINMPARTVVLEKLEKFNGEARVPITPGEYTQLTGRAGRRGIDTEGHSVIVWSPEVEPQAVANLASRRTYPLNSSFAPTYNMAVNLIDQFGRARTRELLESSFAQFQADRAVVDLAQKAKQQQETLAGYERAMHDDRGDFIEYATLRRTLGELERSAARGKSQRSLGEQEQVVARLADARTRVAQHPSHSSPGREERARWAERWFKLKRQNEQLISHIESRTGAVARVFDRVTAVLEATGHVIPDPVTPGELTLSPSGRSLKRIYGERDLLVAESLRRGLWRDLDAAALAALVTTIVYEPRRDELPWQQQRLPRGLFRVALERTSELWAELDDLEHAHGLDGTGRLATGLALPMHDWARGASLEVVLETAEMAAGDFVRWAKQAIDLLDQLTIVADGPLSATARQALDAVRRGIVAYSSLA